MNLIKIFSLAALGLFTLTGFAQWTEVDWAQTDVLTFIDFVDDETGYARMEMLQGFTSSFQKTEDGGQTWTELNLPADVEAFEIQAIDFNSSGEGVLLCRIISSEETLTQVYQTLDDGASWENISADEMALGNGLTDIQMLDVNSIFFVTENQLYRTTNGGDEWNIAPLPATGVSVDFFDADHGVIGAWDGTFLYYGILLSTSDGGDTWNETILNENNSVVGVVKQWNEMTAYAAPVKWGASGFSNFYKTTDSGLNWDEVSLPETNDGATLTEFDFRDENYGVITLASNTQFYIYNTTDGGDTWNLQNQMDQLYTTDLSLSQNSGYISAEEGLLLRLNAPLGIYESKALDVSIYPNPVISGQTIHWEAETKFTQIQIIDKGGKTVFSENLAAQRCTLPNLSSGVYCITLQSEKLSKASMIVVKRVD